MFKKASLYLSMLEGMTIVVAEADDLYTCYVYANIGLPGYLRYL